MNEPLELRLSVSDEQATDEGYRLILQALAVELANQSAEVAIAPIAPSDTLSPDWVAKGNQGSSILDVKIDLAALQTFGKWLYERLVGTTTKVKFEYGDAKFEFEGRNDADRAAAMRDFEAFVARLEAAKQTNHG